MTEKASLREMRGFYHRLDYALEKNVDYQCDLHSRPVVVGGDAAYMVMREEKGKIKLRQTLRNLQEDLMGLADKRYSDGRFKEGTPVFADADIYLRTPHNAMQLHESISSLGYEPSRSLSSIDSRGCMVYVSEELLPGKVEVVVEKNDPKHHRPSSDKPWSTLLPEVDGEASITTLKNYKHMDFITPKSFVTRLERDIAEAGVLNKRGNIADVPDKMGQDLVAMYKLLGVFER